MCRGSCLGNSCNNNQDCAPGEHCSGKYFKVCSNDRKGGCEACDSKTETKSETGWRIAVGLVTPFTVVVVCLCVGCCSRKRKASRESRESIRQRHENRQIAIRRTVEQHEVKRQAQQQCQSQKQSLNIQNLGPYTNQPPPPYPGKPSSPPYPDRPPLAYSTLFPVGFQPQGGISPPPYQSRPPSPSRPPSETGPCVIFCNRNNTDT